MKIRGKTGEERILSVWWVFVIAIILVFISIGVFIFYSYFLDTRQVEADVLCSRIGRCLIKGGYFAFDLEKLSGEDIFSKCNISKKVFDKMEHYVKVSFLNLENEEIRDSIKLGNLDYEVYYGLEGENYPKFSEKNILALDKDNQRIIIKILAGSNQKGKKLS